MSRLHVIWDRDKLLSHDQLPKDKFKVAMVDIARDVEPKDFTKLAEHLAELLLEQFADGSV